jgi:DNA-binding transcriptional MocR family regulator
MEKRSVRSMAREMRVSRNTVRKYLEQAEPRRKEARRMRPVLAEVAPRLEPLVAEWSGATTEKQRITGSRLHSELVSGFQSERYDGAVVVARMAASASRGVRAAGVPAR